MRLPLEIAMEVGSFLDRPNLMVCTMRLCRSGVGFVSRPCTESAKVTTIRLCELVGLCRTASRTLGVVGQEQSNGVATEAIERIDLCLARRTSAEKVVFVVNLKGANARATTDSYSDIYATFKSVRTANLSTAKALLSSGTYALTPSPRSHFCLGRRMVVV
jgi:hypothetical protein